MGKTMVKFVVNGKEVEVEDPNPRSILGDFLREEMGLKGLQMPCRQGGCGACTVLLSPVPTSHGVYATINSCLRPLCAMDGMAVTTIEAVGSLRTGLAPVQKTVVGHNGTQCGFCTPGMIMSMHGLLCNNPNPTSQEVEDQIDGNLCRCTGYRPIFDAFHTLSCGNDEHHCQADKARTCQKLELDMEDICNNGVTRESMKRLVLSKEGSIWIRVFSLEDLYSVLRSYRNRATVRMVRGNTSTGVYPEFSSDVFIDISHIRALLKTSVSSEGIIIGGAVSISNLMLQLKKNTGLSSSYGPMLEHLTRVASPQVRNVGCVAGNLMMAHDHPDFVSDIATILMAAETKLKLFSAYINGFEEVVDLEQFFGMQMDGKVITEIQIPALPTNSRFIRHKVALRRVNAHAILNAAFKFEVDSETDTILSSPIIVYGGIRPFPQRARQTERKLINKSYKDPKVFDECLMLLQKELVLDPSFGRSKYRSILVSTFFYKSILSLWPVNSVPIQLRSAIMQDIRPISSGSIYYDKGDPSEYPVSQALPKLSAPAQAIADAAAKLVHVNYVNVVKPILTIEDAIEADSFFDKRTIDFQKGNVATAFNSAEVIVEGEASVGHQYHFHLETQRSLCIPGEEGCMNVYSSTQNPSQVQHCVASGLNRPEHKIIVNVKHVGGGFGSKINRTSAIAMACAMAADKLQKPVQLLLDLSANMQLVGGRSPYLCKYKFGAQKSGRIVAIQMQVLNNQGAHFDFEYPDLTNLPLYIDGVYNIENWKLEGKIARTNLPACTYMRGPVFVETAFMIETVVEHVSQALELRSELVRELNMYTEGDVALCGQYLGYCNAKLVFDTLKTSSEYQKRVNDIRLFNYQSQWVKRGISMIPIKYGADWEAFQMTCLVNIHSDYSVSIYHSGCEIGQGLDVKVAQGAAMTLGSLIRGQMQMDDIYVHSTTTIVANNAFATARSVTSEICVKVVQDACKQLVSRLQSISKMLSTIEGKPSWEELIAKALDIGIDLQARGRVYPSSSLNGPFQYVSFGAGVTEVEVDILTGETRILRADVLLDCGKSLNPAIDIGQVQGAFVQGLGNHLSEEYIYDKQTGKLITDGTWEYKIPSSKDIPVIFNAALLPNSSNPYGVLRSKFSGEPPYGTACSAIFAIHQAITAAKLNWEQNSWFPLQSPATVEKVALAAAVPLRLLNLWDI